MVRVDMVLSPEDVTGLVHALLAGDPKARDKLILGHIYLVTEITCNYFKRHKDRPLEDLEEIGLFALTQAVDRFPSMCQNINISPYLNSCISNFIKTRESWFTKSKTKNQPNVTTVESTLSQSYTLTEKSWKDFEIEDTKGKEERKSEETLEHLLSLLDRESDKRILHMRLQGYENCDIAEVLNMSTRHVTYRYSLIKVMLHERMFPVESRMLIFPEEPDAICEKTKNCEGAEVHTGVAGEIYSPEGTAGRREV